MPTTLPLDSCRPPRDFDRKSRGVCEDVTTVARKRENEVPKQLARSHAFNRVLKVAQARTWDPHITIDRWVTGTLWRAVRVRSLEDFVHWRLSESRMESYLTLATLR